MSFDNNKMRVFQQNSKRSLTNFFEFEIAIAMRIRYLYKYVLL